MVTRLTGLGDDGVGFILLAGVECPNVIALALMPSGKVLRNVCDAWIEFC